MMISGTNTSGEPGSGIPFGFQELVLGTPEGRMGTSLDTSGEWPGPQNDFDASFTS
jgi:hypothetical protein